MPVDISPRTVAQLSLEEYLHTSYRPDCDFVDGQIEERNVGERERSVLQIAIGGLVLQPPLRVAHRSDVQAAHSRIGKPSQPA
jgi:hypothetical protein